MNISFSFSSPAGDLVLRPAVAVEELGGGQDPGPDDGPRSGHHLRGGEAAEEEAPARLSLLESQESQLLGLQILLLRAAGSAECDRWVRIVARVQFSRFDRCLKSRFSNLMFMFVTILRHETSE